MMLFALLWDQDDKTAVDAGANPPVRPGESQRAVPTPMRATRFIAAIPALYRVIGEEAWQRGLTVNMSDSGVLLEAAAPLAVESLLEMTFHLPERLGSFAAGQLNCVGRVVRRAPPTRSVPYAVAARFVEFR